MPTWHDYRRDLGAALGFHLYTQTSTDQLTLSTNPRTMILPELIDSNLDVDFLDGAYWFSTVSTEVVPVAKNGLLPGTGQVTVAHAPKNGNGLPATSNQNMEFYGVLPPYSVRGRRGLKDAADLALAECWAIDTLLINGVSTTYQYPLMHISTGPVSTIQDSAWPWLDNADKIIDVYVRRAGALRDDLVNEWRFINDAEQSYLEFKQTFSSAEQLKIWAYRPMDTWISYTASSNWVDPGTQGVGTRGIGTSDKDEALLSRTGMITVGLAWCYEFLASEGDNAQRAYWRSMADRQRIKANKWKEAHLPRVHGRDSHWRRMQGQSDVVWPPLLST
jgi:hypothetical protein